MVPSTKPRTELHGDHLYLVLHFPALRHSHKEKEQEVDFVIGKNFLITTRYDTIDSLHKFSKIFEVNSILDKQPVGDHAGFLFFYMMKEIYKAMEDEIEAIRIGLHTIEEKIFAGQEVGMVEEISRAARDLLNIRQVIEPHRDVLRELEVAGATVFGESFTPYLKSLSNEYYRVHNHVMRNTESLHELRETNNSLLTTKQNETMRVLTIMAFLTFPLALLVAIFNLHFTSNPIDTMQNGFWFVVATVLGSGSIMLWYFKHKGWL